MVKSFNALKIFKSWSSPLITEQKNDFKASVLTFWHHFRDIAASKATYVLYPRSPRSQVFLNAEDSQDTVLTQENQQTWLTSP